MFSRRLSSSSTSKMWVLAQYVLRMRLTLSRNQLLMRYESFLRASGFREKLSRSHALQRRLRKSTLRADPVRDGTSFLFQYLILCCYSGDQISGCNLHSHILDHLAQYRFTQPSSSGEQILSNRLQSLTDDLSRNV